jgi:hypothetical protein
VTGIESKGGFPGLKVGLKTDDRSAQYVAQFLGASVPVQPSSNGISVNALPPPNEITVRNIGP